MLAKYSIFSRLFSKLLCELLPAAIVSAVGALLLSHYTSPSVTSTVVVSPADSEMLQMARDEHARIVIYLEKNTEARQQADLVVEQEATRVKAAERAALLAARKAKEAETRVAAMTGAATDKSKKKGLAKLTVQAPDETVVVGEPLQLLAPVNAAVQARAPAEAAGRDDNVLKTKWREATATVERIPSWVHTTVDKLANNIMSMSLPKVRPFQML